MAQQRVDEILDKALTADTSVIPRYDVKLPNGTLVASDAELVLKNPILTPGMKQNKQAWDETLAASGVTTGTARALLLAQPGFVLFDGAQVRFQLHIVPVPNPDVTLNVNGTGAKAIKTSKGVSLGGAPIGSWITVIYSSVLDFFVVQEGNVEPSNKNLLNNWFFADPVNTLGQTTYTANGTTIDNWTSYLLNVTLTSGGLYLTTRTGTDAQIYQRIVGLDTSLTYTFSWIGNGELYSITTIPGSGIWTKIIPNTAYYSLSKWDDDIGVVISLSQGKTMTVTAAKLELGTVSTLARKDANGNWIEIQPPLQVIQNKANKKIPTTAGTIAALSAGGNLLDSGIAPEGVYRRISLPSNVNIKDYLLDLGYSGCGQAVPSNTGTPVASQYWTFVCHWATSGRVVLEMFQAGSAQNRYYCTRTDGTWSGWYKLTATAV